MLQLLDMEPINTILYKVLCTVQISEVFFFLFFIQLKMKYSKNNLKKCLSKVHDYMCFQYKYECTNHCFVVNYSPGNGVENIHIIRYLIVKSICSSY